jgi:hypothetical protein
VRWRLVVFGAGSAGIEGAARRVAAEARGIPEITDAVVESESSLKSEHGSFWAEHRDFIQSNPRLFGFAIWKPFLLGQHLADLPSDWGLMYVDAGCVLRKGIAARKRLISYQHRAEHDGVWATCLDRPRWGEDSFREERWTKADLLDAVAASRESRLSPQWQSGMMLLAPTDANRSLLADWEDLSTNDAYRFSSDSPSRIPNAHGFVEHRHDQSIFSVLAKGRGLTAVGDETWFAPDWFVRGRDFPIWAARWRSARPMRLYDPKYLVRAAKDAARRSRPARPETA